LRGNADFTEAKRLICADIEREIRLAYASERDDFKAVVQPFAIPLGGANFLAAMGLLSYTEFAGKLKYNEKKNGRDWASENFNRFFDDLGLRYKQFRASYPDVYDIFRCGLVHEYYTKDSCDIHMSRKSDKPIGIDVEPSGRYYFVVETYFEDLKHALDQLEKDLYNLTYVT
jgi:hypothetical protein